MNCLTILIRIKEFSFKKGRMPFDNFICIFKNNDFEGRISLMQYKYQYINHERRDINSDIYYKLNVIDFTSNKLIGSSDYCISYNKINNLNIGSSINFSREVKLKISYNSQKDLLNLIISSEIIKFNKISFTIDHNSESKDKINGNINTNEFIYNHNKLNINKNYLKQINNKNKKNPFEYIKIKKINTSRKKENSLNKDNECNINCISSGKRYDRNKANNNNKLEIIYKREFDSPSLLFSEEDKKNINLNMHNICVQNYYAITSSQPSININPIIEKKNNSQNKIYTKKNLNCNRLNIKTDKEIKNDNYLENNDYNHLKDIKSNYDKIGIKRCLAKKNLDMKNNKDNSTNHYINRMIMPNFLGDYKNKNIKNIKNIEKEKIKKTKNKTKDIDKISEKFITKNNKENIDIIKSNEILNKNYYFLFDNKNKMVTNKNKKNNQICPIKTFSSVDKVKNKTFKHNYNKIVKINNLFRNSTIDLENNNSIIKKKPFTTNLSKYLDNFNNNILANSSSFKKKDNNKKYKFEKCSNIISPKSYSLRDNSNNNLKKRIYNSNSNLHAGIKNMNLNDNNYHIFIEENNNINTIDKNNYIYQKNLILYENDFKNKTLTTVQSNILLSKKVSKLKKECKQEKIKLSLIKEKYLHKLQTKNNIEQKRNINKINNYIHVNINCQINNKIIPKIIKIKQKEKNIYENIFNISINNIDKYDQIAKENIQKENENKLVCLLLELIKNIVNHHGDITQIFNDNIYKKRHLFFILINNGIGVNNFDYFYSKLRNNDKLNEINKKYKCKEIKEEIEEEREENEEEEIEENKLNISIIYKRDNILDKILINDFPNKYKHITDKKFIKTSSNEYIFNNEIKVFAFYKDDRVYLQIENESIYDSCDNEYSLEEFISKYIKNKDKLTANKKEKYLSPIQIKRKKYFCSQKTKKTNYNNFIEILERTGVKRKKFKKKNLCVDKYSRNHKINEIELNQENFKKKFLNEKILLTNESIINDSNIIKEDNNDNKPKENISK